MTDFSKIHFLRNNKKWRSWLESPYFSGLFVVMLSWGGFFTWLWPQMFFRRSDGIWAGVARVWADWSAHASYASVFAYRPPSLWFDAHPLYALRKFTYPFFADAVSGLLIKMGLDMIPAFVWPSIVMTLLLLWFLYTFYWQMLGRAKQAVAALTLFLAGGGLGFVYWLQDLWQNPVATLIFAPGEYTHRVEQKIEWLNVIIGQLLPQRAFLFGIPLTLLVLIWLWWADKREWKKIQLWQPVLMGIYCALLQTVHVHSFMVLGFVGFVYALMRPRFWKWWLVWGTTTAIMALPIYSWLYGGEIGTSFFAWQPGWLAAAPRHNINVLLWWFINWGPFIPLALWAMYTRPRWRHPFVVAATLIFVVSNLILFQPHDWDNSKMLTWTYLIWAAPVVALLSSWWHSNSKWLKTAVVLLYLSMTVAGGLDLYRHTQIDKLNFRLWSNDEIELAAKLRKVSQPTARVLVTDANNHWVTNLTGRQILLGYRGWMWTYGIDYSQVYADMRVMFAGGSKAEPLLDKYDIDYVVMGPHERGSSDYPANEAYYAAHYPVIVSQANMRVYDVRFALPTD